MLEFIPDSLNDDIDKAQNLLWLSSAIGLAVTVLYHETRSLWRLVIPKYLDLLIATIASIGLMIFAYQMAHFFVYQSTFSTFTLRRIFTAFICLFLIEKVIDFLRSNLKKPD